MGVSHSGPNLTEVTREEDTSVVGDNLVTHRD